MFFQWFNWQSQMTCQNNHACFCICLTQLGSHFSFRSCYGKQIEMLYIKPKINDIVNESETYRKTMNTTTKLCQNTLYWSASNLFIVIVIFIALIPSNCKKLYWDNHQWESYDVSIWNNFFTVIQAYSIFLKKQMWTIFKLLTANCQSLREINWLQVFRTS